MKRPIAATPRKRIDLGTAIVRYKGSIWTVLENSLIDNVQGGIVLLKVCDFSQEPAQP